MPLSFSLEFILFGILGSECVLLLLYVGAKKKGSYRSLFLGITIAFNGIYLIFRLLYTLPFNYGIVSLLLGILLLAAEGLGFFQSVLFRVLLWKPYQPKVFPKENWTEKPTVDVFIMTINEDVSLLKKTIAGCLNLNYPKDQIRITLCDDGNREAVAHLCGDLGVSYLARSEHEDAKAGNINHALLRTSGELVLWLDADMVPKPEFLNRTVPYFADPMVGFVQTPQVFRNPDPFQYNLGFQKRIPNEQDFFMIDVQGGRARFNAVLHVGTNAVFRRSAVAAIGGIPTGTITEDMATGMLIQAKGYESIFLKETLCTGLAVEGFSDLLKQRERWSRGNIQVVKKWNPLTVKGLNTIQRLIYIDGFFYWFFGLQKSIYLALPIVYLIFGLVVLDTNAMNLLLFWLPSFLASALSFRFLVGKRRTITWSHIYEVAMAPYLGMVALMELFFSRPIPFRVTPKGKRLEHRNFSFFIAIPHLLLYFLTILGWAISILQLIYGYEVNLNAFAINLVWSVYNFIGIVMGILVCVERPRVRTAERLATHEPIRLLMNDQMKCEMVDLSESGLKLMCPMVERLSIPGVGSRINVSGSMFDRIEGEIKWQKTTPEGIALGVQFTEQGNEVYQAIVRYISERDNGYHVDERV